MSLKWYLTAVLICISLAINDIKHLFMRLVDNYSLFWRNVYSNSLLIFELNYLLFGTEC